MEIRMRLRPGLIAIVVLVAAAAVGLTGGLAASPPSFKQAQARAVTVDVQLVLAVDISYSMDPDELALQRQGYIEALTSPEFLQAIRQGINGRVALLYFEWAGVEIQHIVVPWRMIDGPESADAFASEVARAPQRRGSRTSISGALAFAMPLFEGGGFKGLRRIIDVSGDGVNNNGPPVTLVRDEVLAKGITINGLPIMLKRPHPGRLDIDNLDIYYEDCVIGGPGAFVVPIRAREEFKAAIRTKLVLEIAGLTPAPRLLRTSAAKPRISCTIGEQMWQQRWGN
jgi:hypothetical protein